MVEAKSYIVNRQCRFIHRLIAHDKFHDTYEGNVFTVAIEARCPAGLVLRKLQSMGPNYDYDANCQTTTQTANQKYNINS